jgi:hypothetical protein
MRINKKYIICLLCIVLIIFLFYLFIFKNKIRESYQETTTNSTTELSKQEPHPTVLTKENYENIVINRYDITKFTSIPNLEFNKYESSVDLTGFTGLETIADEAFSRVKGTVTMTGNYPNLKTIGIGAFGSEGKDINLSRIEFLDLPELSLIDTSAFHGFKGTLIMRGNFPKLHTINSFAFFDLLNDNSNIEFLELQKLKFIGMFAFGGSFFKASLKFNGCYPNITDFTNIQDTKAKKKIIEAQSQEKCLSKCCMKFLLYKK